MKVDTLVAIVKSSQDETEVDDELLNDFCFNYAYGRFRYALFDTLLAFYKDHELNKDHLTEMRNTALQRIKTNKSMYPEDSEKNFENIYLECIYNVIDEFLKVK